MSNLQELISDINNNSSILETRIEAVRQIRRRCSTQEGPPIQEVIESGVLPRLVSFLGDDNEEALQREASWALTNITSGSSEQTIAVVEAGAIPLLVNLLSSKDLQTQEQATWALGNIAGDSPRLRDLVLESGAMHPILRCLCDCKRVCFEL